MTGSLVINNLAGLLVITSLLVILAKNPKASAALYAMQSFVLVLIFVALGSAMGSHELYVWAGTAFLTKVVLVSTIMYFAFNKMSDSKVGHSAVSPAWVIVCAIIIMLLCYLAVDSVEIDSIADFKPVLAVSLGHFMIGLLCIVTQRNILKQVFGYCLMENGAHLTLALLANKAPELVEIGVATDAIFAVIVMVYIVKRIYNTLHTLDAQELTALKG